MAKRISKKAYAEAKQIVEDYENQLRASDGKKCFILNSMYGESAAPFVTLDEEFATRSYETGNYHMIVSQIVNP